MTQITSPVDSGKGRDTEYLDDKTQEDKYSHCNLEVGQSLFGKAEATSSAVEKWLVLTP